ncbi:SIMPL domain-containing protein [Tropicimonas sp. IMCC34043]|uniref:SIMPL domain-containing protein n=1 Tax=Tropicimonas sp. IMCC34043 TaxID=2248760 RepID=UPI000E28573F|nr:SIMPL domain-containing protein [Tropicimonas sp. IMCC34043]
MRRIPTLALILALIAPVTGASAQDGVAQQDPGRLTVTAEGRVEVAPDMAVVTLGVVAEDPDAEVAIARMTEGMEGVMSVVEAAGIAPRDVQTSSLTLSPRWSERRDDDATPPKIESFVASMQVTLRQRDLDGLGALLDQVVKGGANSFRGLSFDLQEPQEAEDAARLAAVAEARRRAELYAGAAGVRLGPILTIDEIGGSSPMMFKSDMAEFRGAAASIPVASGELSISSTVAITWSLLPAE